MSDLAFDPDLLTRAVSVEVVEYPVLRITYEDGLIGLLNMTDTIKKHAERRTGLIALLDPEFFSRCKVVHGGRAIAWSEYIDMDAGAQRPHLNIEKDPRKP